MLILENAYYSAYLWIMESPSLKLGFVLYRLYSAQLISCVFAQGLMIGLRNDTEVSHGCEHMF